ncbi:RNA-binding protein (plasmid) [Aneurinibacillus sp. Ricciae_BoGa-3]|uniref:RNA-binding protein n=1 Tax=Aneurinibacillus sp. Ricciae_BoGa-3 TaxID=3022697 RepID=UPI00233FEAA3|nr:RNA-binding protein [Aneurinibacillus sp. Ricciae_BoGa-3]WCK57049.1 RNA-binding protein [Aneurinibacillus sp. Ricciae_BoGa-3]
MKTIEKVQQMNSNKIVTYEGGVGYQTTFRETIAEFFSLGLLEGNFYQSSADVLKNAKDIFERALKEEPEFATKSAIYGNNVNSLKLVPSVWLLYLSTLEDKTLFKKAFPRIIQNPKMLHDFLEMARKGGVRDGVGRGVKKVINKWLVAKLNEYQVSRNKGKLSEVIKVTRPDSKKESEEFQAFMQYLAKDALTFPRAVGLKSVIEKLEQGIVDDETLSLVEQHRLQLEELKHSTKNLSDEGKQALYAQMYKGLNYSALILNLVALERVFATETTTVNKLRRVNGQYNYYKQQLVVETDIPDAVIEMVVEKINDVKAYRKSNMLPFALITAERMVVTPAFKSALGNVLKQVASEAFSIDKSINLKVAVDTSSSMNSQVTDSLSCVELATLFGAMVKKAHAKSEVYAVASQIKKVPIRKQDELFDMAHQIEETKVGAGTLFEQIMREYKGEKYIILFTDSESADDLERVWLKAKKPKDAKLIVWQLQAYQTRISKDPSVVYLAGYSDRLMGLVKNIIEGKAGQIEEIENVEL